MEKEIIEMFKDAENDKAKLKALKVAAVKCQNFLVAAELMDIEKKNFPDTKEATEAKKKAEELNLLFRMVDLNIPKDVAWMINEVLTKFKRRRGNFDIKDAAEIKHQRLKFWDSEGDI